MRSRLGHFSVVLMLAVQSAANGDVVERRGSEPKLQGRVTKIDDGGVELNSETGTRFAVPWDRVRLVTLERPDPALEQYQEDAHNLWRARTRLERHDAALAESLFERLFEKHRGKKHETALVVAEGLLRCRLARGAHDAAVIPALETARLRQAGVTTLSYSGLSPVYDEITCLCMALPPVFNISASLSKLERDLGAYDAQGQTVIAAHASLYRRAIRQQLGMDTADDERVLAANHAGVKLLSAMVESGSTDSQHREAARRTILADLPALPAWAQAWSYYFVGASLLAENGVGRQLSGMVSLAHLPARFGDAQPFLGALALAQLAEACESSGQSAAASSLRSELSSRFPNHAAASPSRTRAATTRPTTMPASLTKDES